MVDTNDEAPTNDSNSGERSCNSTNDEVLGGAYSKITKYILSSKALTNESNYTNTILKTSQNSVGFLAFEKDTVILSESVGATELGSEGVSALSEALYKTSALTYLNHSLYPSQAHYSFNINRQVATSNDDLYESGRADEPGSEQGKALAETFCNNTILTFVSHYYLSMNDILESTVTGLSDFHRSGLPLVS
ncbi:hypothetical protein C2G38_2178698 [Gigaspora rosea]|uniref:Uncharacterized protein n=1 Tax=Gigaspora rosea TaxID=44941 RepID=A0A397VI53_9GLOM|nr:hypothetical protein C2G38_2178698 [Gigaspora rosea]